jgi:hypothetical protein
LAVSDPRVVFRAKEGSNYMFRIQAAPSELDFKPVTSTSSTTAEGEGFAEGRFAVPASYIDRTLGIDRAIGEMSDEF